MTATSLIGFGVVFLLVAWTTSGLLALLVAPLAARGPAVQRRIAYLAAALPVVIAGAIVAILAIQSLVGLDHCDTHGDHAHLCLQHGMGWAERPWAVAAIAAGLAIIATRTVVVIASSLRGRALVARLRATLPSAEAIQIVPNDRVFCFVAGLRRPTIYASSAARELLARDEWEAMLAHETSHIRHRDLWHRLVLEGLLVFAAPGAGIAIREHFDHATERLRDADAAEVTSSESVATALVQMARAQTAARLANVASFTPTGARILATRVEALLDGARRGENASRIGRIALGATFVVVAVVTAFAEPVHHALETLLG